MKYQEDESVKIEFKSALPKNDQIIKTIIAFCNQHGGKLVLGVEDDGTILGIKEKEAVELMEYLERSIYQASAPPILPRVYLRRFGEKVVLEIEVSEGMNKPYYRVADGVEKGTYIRLGKNTVRATPNMIEELRWQSHGLSFDTMPVYEASEDDLDKNKINAFLKNRRQRAKADSSNEVMSSYKLTTEQHSKTYPTVAGILCFGKNVQYYFSEAMVICSHFKGKRGREAIAAIDCNGTLFEQFEQAYHFIISRLNHSFTIKDVKREEKLEVPEVAIREILLNAIIHRNYHQPSPSKVAIYDDRIEIFSPDNFPAPLPSLELGLTNVRNMAICRLFREAKYIEKLGSGFITVFESYADWGLAKPIVEEGNGFVKCILPRESFEDGEEEEAFGKVLKLFNMATEISVSDVMETLNMPRATASRRLSQLVKDEKIKSINSGKATRYIKS